MRACISAVLGAVLAAALGACTGSFFKSSAPPTSTYLLSVTAAGQAGAAAIPADLTVLMPRVRTGLDNDRIAALYPDRRLDYYAAARWSGPLDEVVQDLALQAFHGRFRNVGTDTSAFRGGYWLELEVVDFQAEYTGSAPAAAENHLAAVIAAYEAAAQRALDEIVEQSTQTLAALPTPAR